LADMGALARLFRACVDLRRLLEEVGRRWRPHPASERLVLIGADDHRARQTRLHALRGRVEGLAEFHDVEAALTESGTDRRTRICLPRWDPQLHVSDSFTSI